MDKHALAIIIASILIGLTPFIIEELTLEKQEQVLYSNVTVMEANTTGELSLGVTTVDKLDFGEMPETVEYERKLNVSAPRKTLLRLSVEGNISDIMNFESKHLFEGSRSIPIMLNASEPGYYDGNVTVKTLSAENELGERWLHVKSGEFLPSY